ncbi:MAG: AAA family ATPase, partial [bacterium]
MTPKELQQQLKRIAQARLQLSIMIWGPPGIGKSSIVQQVGDELKLPVIDLRLSQLAPTDLRG